MFNRLLPATPPERRLAKRFLVVLGLVAIAALAVVLVKSGTWSHATAKALSAGKKPKLDYLVQVWAWRGLLVDGLLALGLCLTVRWWVGRADAKARPPGAGRRFWIMAVAILALAAGLRAPRLGLSFYNDELHNFVRMTSGELERTSITDDTLIWDPTRWVETLWYNGPGNNSQPHSILARLCYDTWKTLVSGADGEVCEWVVRLPAFAAGLASLLVLGLAVREVAGTPTAGLTMLAGTLHGWHVRYSTEARGYSLMLLGITLMFFFGQRALKYSRWRDWLGYAFANFLVFWAFPGSAYFLLAFNGCVVVSLVAGKRDWESLKRLCAAGAMSMLVMLPLMLPLIPQLLEAVKNVVGLMGTMDSGWWLNVLGYILLGCRWLDADAAGPQSLAVARLLMENPLWWLAVLGAGGIVLLGICRMLKAGGMLRLIAVASGLAVFLAWGDMARQGKYLNFWYLTFAIPAVACALGVGIVQALQVLRLQGRKQVLPGILLAVVAMAFTTRISWATMHRSKGDERAAVLQVRGSVYPHYMADEQAKKPLLAVVWSNAAGYDPLGLVIHDTATFEQVKQRAITEQRPLYVVMGHRVSALAAQPDTVKQLEGAGFEPVATYHGLDEEYYAQRLFRMR